LIIGAVLGLTQSRIKRLYAYSTISHLGFILLALSINSIESIQSFIFYLMQYSITNLNAFIILIAIGYSLYLYINKNTDIAVKTPVSLENSFASDLKEEEEKEISALDKDNSPIQLLSEMKGYFYINPYLAISLALTLFSFVGIPPLIGFFAKQMVLSSALDNGYIFMVLIAILSSVISAFYYLVLVKQIFFDKSDYIRNPALLTNTLKANLKNRLNNNSKEITINLNNIQLSSFLTIIVSLLTLIMLLFILIPQE